MRCTWQNPYTYGATSVRCTSCMLLPDHTIPSMGLSSNGNACLMCSCEVEYDSVDELEAACQADATCQAYSTGALSGDALCLTSDHVPKSQSEFKECHVKTIGGYGMCSFSVSVLLCTHTCTGNILRTIQHKHWNCVSSVRGRLNISFVFLKKFGENEKEAKQVSCVCERGKERAYVRVWWRLVSRYTEHGQHTIRWCVLLFAALSSDKTIPVCKCEEGQYWDTNTISCNDCPANTFSSVENTINFKPGAPKRQRIMPCHVASIGVNVP